MIVYEKFDTVENHLCNFHRTEAVAQLHNSTLATLLRTKN